MSKIMARAIFISTFETEYAAPAIWLEPKTEQPLLRGKAQILETSHYLIIGDDQVVEVLPYDEPDIAVYQMRLSK